MISKWKLKMFIRAALCPFKGHPLYPWSEKVGCVFVGDVGIETLNGIEMTNTFKCACKHKTGTRP